MKEWWEMIRNGSRRDQLSINFVLWKQGLQYVVFPGQSRHNEWAYWMGHRPATLAQAQAQLAQRERELLDLRTTLDFIRGSAAERLERNLRRAGERRNDNGDGNQSQA